MITKSRIGMDINIDYSILRVDIPENLNNAENICIKLTHTQSSSWQLPNTFELVGDNTLKIKIKGEDQTKLGTYRLIVSYTKYNPDREPHAEPFILDSLAFELVAYSDMVSDVGCCSNLSVTQIDLTSTLDKCKDGNDGSTPEIGTNGNWWIRGVDTEQPAQGGKGDKGFKGDRGDAFNYSDFTTEQLANLKGDKGDTPQLIDGGNAFTQF